MKKTNAIKVLVLMLAVSLLLLAGCSAKGMSLTVRITGPDSYVLFDQAVTVTTKQPTAMDATSAAIKQGGLKIEESDGFVSAISDIQSTQTDGWLLYINGEIASVGAKEQAITEGDTVEWRYVNYDEVFGQTAG